MSDMGCGFGHAGTDAGHCTSDAGHVSSDAVALGPAGWSPAEEDGRRPPAPPSPGWFKLVPMAPFVFFLAAAITAIYVPPRWTMTVAFGFFGVWLLFAAVLWVTGRKDRKARKVVRGRPIVTSWTFR